MNTSLSLSQAAQALHDGYVVAIPTQTVYGLAARIDNPDAVARVAQLKGRPASKPSPVLIPNASAIKDLLTAAPPSITHTLTQCFWPGALTLIFAHALPSLSPRVRSAENTIALRQDGHPLLAALFEHIPFALTGTSANLSGEPPITEGLKASAMFGEMEGYAGHLGDVPSPMQTPSTILDLTQNPTRILRQGPITPNDLAVFFPHLGA